LFAGHGEFGRGARLSSASEPVFQQFRRDVPAGVKDAQDQTRSASTAKAMLTARGSR
jgi:hypothetical protein